MNHAESSQLKPFVESDGGQYRLGYRVVGNAKVVLAVEMPAPIIEQAVVREASLSVRIDAEGKVITGLSMSHIADGVNFPSETAPIDDLVRRVTDAENLHMEEVTADDLKILLERLERSVGFVKAAINRWQMDRNRDRSGA